MALSLRPYDVVCLEEPDLRRKFGSTYEDYRQAVPRWLPRRPTG